MKPACSFFFSAIAAALLLLCTPFAKAGHLDLAVIQFAELVTQEQLDAALAPENLFEATNADRVIARAPVLRGASVLFAQSMNVASSGAFANSTRIGNQRAEVTGLLESGRIRVEIALSEGVDAGLRRFSRKVYQGSGAILAGPPRTLSLRQIKTKDPNVRQGKSKMVSREWTMAVVYQYRP